MPDKDAGQPAGMEQVLPQWKSSLGEIQRASAALLESNSALTAEHNQVKQELEQLQAKIDAERTGNAKMADEIAQWQAKGRQAGDPVEIARVKALLAQRELEVKEQQDALAAAKLRRGSAESHAAVMRVQVADLAVVAKMHEVDMKAQSGVRIEEVRAETERVKDRTAITAEQIRLLGEKTAELAALKTPYLPQAREMVRVNAELKGRVASLSSMKEQALAEMSQLDAAKGLANADVRVQRLRQLLAQRDEMQAHLKDNTAKLEALNTLKPEELVDPMTDDEAQAQKIERQNAFIEDEIGNLRENIALLEYKVTTLERYDGRNKPVSKVK